MNESLCSILCGEDEWSLETEHKAMKFNSDGTGGVCRFLRFPALKANCLFKSYGAVAISHTGLL